MEKINEEKQESAHNFDEINNDLSKDLVNYQDKQDETKKLDKDENKDIKGTQVQVNDNMNSEQNGNQDALNSEVDHLEDRDDVMVDDRSSDK